MHGRHDERLCFWFQATRQSDANECFGENFDEHGCVVQAEFLRVVDSMSDILCQIGHQFTAPTFDELVVHIIRDHDMVVTKSVRQDSHGACHCRHLVFICGHNERSTVARVNRLDGPLGQHLYHALLGKVLKCRCGLPFASIQHLAVHYRTCTVDFATAATTVPLLKA